MRVRFSDFEYDGIALSDKGLAIVSFDGAQDDDIETDSQRTFNSISLFGGRYQPFITSVFEDRLEVEFSIGKNYCEEVLIVSPEKFEATIPEKTEDVRFVLGLEYYPLSVYKSTIDGEYTVEYFYETYDEIFGPGPHCIPFKDDARTVKVLPKEPGERDHVIRYLYMADLKDKNTDYVIQTVFYNEYIFYLPEEVAERYNRERYQ